MFTKNLAPPLIENEISEASYLYQIHISKTINTCPNHHTEFFKFLFIYLQGIIQRLKRFEISFQAIFFTERFSQFFFFFLKYYINQPNFITRLCLLPKLFSKMRFVFHAQAFDDAMTFEYLKSFDYLKNDKSI